MAIYVNNRCFFLTWHLISNPKINYNVLYMYIWTWWKLNGPYSFQMLEILKMIIIYCVEYVHSHTMAFVNERKITSNRRLTIQLLYWFTSLYQVIWIKCGNNQPPHRSTSTYFPVIWINSGNYQPPHRAYLLIFQAFAAKRFNYINASHQVHIFASEKQIFVNREPFMLFIFSVMLWVKTF